MSQLFRISRITIFSKLKINESRTEIYEKSKEFRKKKKEKKKTNITTNFTFPVDKNKCILARRGTDPAQSHRINMSPDEPQRNILFFLSFFFAREGDEREREEWVCKKRTKEIERGEEKRGKGQIEEGRDSLNLENRAQPHFRREGRPLPAPRRSLSVPYFIRLRLDSTNPQQPFLRPPIYNSPAMRRSRTKDEGKIPR